MPDAPRTNAIPTDSCTVAHQRPLRLTPVAKFLARHPNWSRSGLYRAAGAGKIRLLKCGRTTLVDEDSTDAADAALPLAVIKATPK